MIWLIGIGGFLLGFGAGQYILLRLTKDQTREDVLRLVQKNGRTRLLYGLLNWLCAGAGAFIAVTAWHVYGPPS